MLTYPKIGDVVHLKRIGEIQLFGIVVGYNKMPSTGQILVNVNWFDGLTSSEYSYRLEVLNG